MQEYLCARIISSHYCTLTLHISVQWTISFFKGRWGPICFLSLWSWHSFQNFKNLISMSLLSQWTNGPACNFQVLVDFLTRGNGLIESDFLDNIWMTCKSDPWMRISTQLSNEADTLVLRNFSGAYSSYIKEKNIHKYPSSFCLTLVWNVKTLFRLNSLWRSYCYVLWQLTWYERVFIIILHKG